MEQAINSSTLESTTSDKSVILSWPKLPSENGKYEIFKNDEKIGETANLTYTDEEISIGEEYKYTIKTQISLPQKEAQKVSKRIAENQIKLTTEEKNEIFNVNGEISTFIKVPENTEEELYKSEKLINTEDQDQANKFSTKSLPRDNAYAFVYRTFIPYKSVNDPLRGKYLKGDNRSFATDSSKFRTEVIENVQFSGPTSATQWKKIGKSHRCEDADCKKIIESATASSKRIQHSVNILKSDRIQWTVRHAAAVPFNAPYPDIDYQYYADLKKYTVTLSGTHDGAPNHEFYVFNMGGSSRFIHSHSVKSKADFWKLLGAGMGNFWKVTI
ncbi:DUF3238 domain-containing protein [Bacillus sp. T17B1]|uniref:DUF3238 domain-containing protein n=1 Tax=Bacillus sp. T17B1 TaxID=2918911 RepID=UPI002282A889|nr:DUF3238 domain-containing protein [Bacillus sp. T17B1]